MVQYCTLNGLIVSVDMHGATGLAGKRTDGHGLMRSLITGVTYQKLVLHTLLHALVHALLHA